MALDRSLAATGLVLGPRAMPVRKLHSKGSPLALPTDLQRRIGIEPVRVFPVHRMRGGPILCLEIVLLGLPCRPTNALCLSWRAEIHAAAWPEPWLRTFFGSYRWPAQPYRTGVEGRAVGASHVFADEVAVEPFGEAHVVPRPAAPAVVDQEPRGAAVRLDEEEGFAPVRTRDRPQPVAGAEAQFCAPTQQARASSGSRPSQGTSEQARAVSRIHCPRFHPLELPSLVPR